MNDPMKSDVKPHEHLIDLYRVMVRIRRFEQAVAQAWRAGEVPGLVHTSIGGEAVAAAVCTRLDPERGDRITSTHRGHGHAIALGLDAGKCAAEIFGRRDGLCRGRGGSMHLADPQRGLIGCNGIVGGGVPAALGAAFAAQREGNRAIAVAFFGDGAMNQGAVLESLNLARVLKLPVLFVIEDNGFGEYTPAAAVTAGDIATRLAAFDLRMESIDGGDATGVDAAAEALIAYCRAGHGPAALHARTVRLTGHHEGDAQAYRRMTDDAPAPASPGGAADPLVRLRAELKRECGIGEQELDSIVRSIDIEVEAALRFARLSPLPDPTDMTVAEVWAAPPHARPAPSAAPGAPEIGEETTMAGALNAALADAMAEDERVFLIGEDVRAGVFGVTGGLVERFGAERVIDTPISESAFVGLALGAAVCGLRPVVEVMFADFTAVCFDQIVNQIAKWRFMTGGQVSVPLVIRAAAGAGLRAGAQHSQSFAHLFASFSGLKCAMPGTPQDAYHALRAAIADPDPVIFLEPKALYEVTGPVVRDGHAPSSAPLSRHLRTGEDLTLVAFAGTLPGAIEAAGRLAREENIAADLIAPIGIRPFDMTTLTRSLARTRRLLVVDDGSAVCGLADHVIAAVAKCGIPLAAPPASLTPPMTPVPFSPPLEDAWRPDATRIFATARALVRGETIPAPG
ncbi:MAG: 2-oxoisovalerate dehydrogenase [Alphaproteobacteria bacterium]|nr:MAG: 2-oxoisovalerate dehydrogenase [Alphaproteobacteria bacterium]